MSSATGTKAAVTSDAADGEVAPVAGADEHPVEHEDDAGDRLEEAATSSTRPSSDDHLGVVGEERTQHRRGERQQDAGDRAGGQSDA